ncbi:MAG: hypothetical protein IAG13_16360 [Deltaproteobacteria bacterium]|nr:hypothetical protein [Nannocystaceae bacterium]
MNENAVIITHATRIVDVEAQLRAGADDVFLTSVESAVAMRPAVLAVGAGSLSDYLEGRRSVHEHLRGRSHALD